MKLSVNKKLVVSIFIVVATGVLLGFLWAIRRPVDLEEAPRATISAETEIPQSFGSFFSAFIIGRPGDNSAIRKNTPIVRSNKFVAGEKVGLRVQTNPEIKEPFDIEIRFMKSGNGEETSLMEKSRQSFKIQPGLRTYCCLLIPREIGKVNLSILTDDVFLGNLNGFTIIPPRENAAEGGLFGL